MIRFDNHAFKALDVSLRQLFTLIGSMGHGIEQLVALLPEAIEASCEDCFARAKGIDKTINTTELEVDATVAAIINKFTIIGEDLRFTLACIKIAGILERAADKVKNCIKRLSRVAHPLEPTVKAELTRAVDAMGRMIPLALAQVIDYTPEATQELLRHGATVQQAYREMLLHLYATSASENDKPHLLLVAKNLEQAADMAVEVMKISHFIHTGTKYEKNAGG